VYVVGKNVKVSKENPKGTSSDLGSGAIPATLNRLNIYACA